MKIKRFEDIQAWQEARKLVNLVYDSVNNNDKFGRDFRLKDQFTSSAVSVMSNISEGFCRRSNREFVQFLFIAKASVAENQSILYIALDQSYISNAEFEKLYEQTDKVARLISNFISYLIGKSKTQPTQ